MEAFYTSRWINRGRFRQQPAQWGVDSVKYDDQLFFRRVADLRFVKVNHQTIGDVEELLILRGQQQFQLSVQLTKWQSPLLLGIILGPHRHS